MDAGWYPIAIPCPKCGQQMSLVQASYSADGELLYQFGCLKCAAVMYWRVFACQLQNAAQTKDIEKRLEGKVKPAKTVQPPLQIAAPPFTDSDRAFEKSCGIQSDEEC